MKSELEKKLNKLPSGISDFEGFWDLYISKDATHWLVAYADEEQNAIIHVKHKSLEAAVDKMLKELNLPK